MLASARRPPLTLDAAVTRAMGYAPTAREPLNTTRERARRVKQAAMRAAKRLEDPH